jgi:hypothetical protein
VTAYAEERGISWGAAIAEILEGWLANRSTPGRQD